MPNKFPIYLFAALLFAGISACSKLLPPAPEESAVLDGPISGLSTEQQRRFLLGDEAFGEIFTPQTGLGAVFVAHSCASCHTGDGKGHPSTNLTRFGRMEGGVFNPMSDQGGPQQQNRAIPGYEAEPIPAAATGISRFAAPAVTGLGYLAAVHDSVFLNLADPNDADADGISGRIHYVDPPAYFQPDNIHISQGGQYMARFGKKAGAITLLQQTVNAYREDMGITSDQNMEEPVNYATGNPYNDGVADPEVSSATVDNLVFYLHTLKAPVRRNTEDPTVMAGENLFGEIGCAKCHIPTLKTAVSDISVLSETEFHPYTDLLLHDLGSEVDDGYTEGNALTSEWKTPALWGLGLSPEAQGGQYYLMHDGRAHSLEEAIQLHGGEGSNSRAAFNALSQADKEALILFLGSL